jgi:hypothetical protein
MFERIRRGWGIAKASWSQTAGAADLVRHAFLLLIASIVGSAFAGGQIRQLRQLLDNNSYDEPVLYALVFAFYFVSILIAVYFNAGLISCALEAFVGRQPSLRAGLAAATRRLPQILGWALVAATVGLLLNVVQGILMDRLGFLGSLLGGLLEVARAVVTYFVVPVLVVEGVGPIEAVKRSSAILMRTWGESVGGEGGLGLISVLLVLPAMLVFALVAAASQALDNSGACCSSCRS